MQCKWQERHKLSFTQLTSTAINHMPVDNIHILRLLKIINTNITEKLVAIIYQLQPR